jgi:hypothetical protein
MNILVLDLCIETARELIRHQNNTEKVNNLLLITQS